jgi:serine/threonine protein kinase
MHTPPNPDPSPRRPADSPGDPAPVPPSVSTTSHPAAPPPEPSAHRIGSSAIRLRPAPPDNTDDAPTVLTAGRPKTTARPIVAGQRLGHFELIEAVGAGGMATVLKARDLELGRTVALKLLPPETARDPEAVTRFKQEARAAAKLDHDNVARVYFCGEDQGQHFIAFEFVEGETLRQMIDRRGTVPPEDCVRYMLHVCAGLAHAADRGVVHRDIKPSNILITPEGKAKIVDMGLARHLGSHSVNGGVTQSGVTLGTFDYISPEQALDPRQADVRSDIYSLGCTFYHALTGRPPVPEGTAAKKLYAHQHEYPLDPRVINPQVPDALAVVLSKMMAKDPARRYQSPAELTRDLAAIAREWGLPLDGVPMETGVLTALPAEPLIPDPPRLPIGWLAVVSVLAVAVAVFIGVTGSTDPPLSPPWNEPAKPAANVLPADPPTPLNGAMPAPPPAVDRAVRNAREFAAAIKAGQSRIRLLKGRTYDLATLTEPVVFTGDELSLVAVADPDSPPHATRPPVVRVVAAPLDAGSDSGPHHPGALVIRRAKQVTFEGIAIEVTAWDDDDFFEIDPVVGLWFADVGRIKLDSVRVRQDPSLVGERLIGLVVSAAAARSEVAIAHALFDLGPQGIGLRMVGRVSADVRQAAFAPHEAAIQLAPGANGAAGEELALRECTFMLDATSAAVEAEAGAAVRIEAGYCVFAAASAPPAGARMPGAGVADVRPAVLRVAADFLTAASGTRFIAREGQPNAYYHTFALATTTRGYTFDEAQYLGPPIPAIDSAPVILTAGPPWEEPNPRALLTDPDHPEYAFRLDLKDRKVHTDPPVSVLGAQYVAGPTARIYYDKVYPLERPKPPVQARGNERVFYPDAELTDAKDRIYNSFLTAFDQLQPGETLLIAANGPVPIPSLPAEKPNLRAAIRAYPGYTPELVGGQTRLRDAGLFRLTDGELTFDNLAINLSARQSVVAVFGGQAVTFKNCLITLDERNGDPQAAVVIADPAREMRMGPAELPAAPRVTFENTLVRGRGRAVWVQAARPFELIGENSAFALDGPFLHMDPPPRDLPAAVPAAVIYLARVTALLNGPLLDVAAPRDPTGRVVQLAVEVNRCLFAPVIPQRPRALVVVEDADPLAEPRKYLTWQTLRSSLYANYSRLAAALELRPTADDGMPPFSMDLPRWLEFVQDDSLAGVEVLFAGGRDLRSRLPDLRAADLRAELAEPDFMGSTAVDVGADVATLGVLPPKR